MSDPVGQVLAAGTQAATAERERASALSAVIANAADMGLDEALQKFAGGLSPAEQEMLRSLKPEELKALSTAQSKIASLAAKDSNNNNIYI